jgi:hypothetical protein
MRWQSSLCTFLFDLLGLTELTAFYSEDKLREAAAMEEHDPANLENDFRLPSGPWTGFFLQYWLPGRHRTNLRLLCQGGGLTGEGGDRVGPFTMNGTYDLATGRCEWTKKYRGRHTVTYRGVNDGHGIWGVWELPQLGGLFVDRGGFHIWPEGTDISEESEQTERAVLAVMREEFGSRFFRAIRGFLVVAAAIAVALIALWRWKY